MSKNDLPLWQSHKQVRADKIAEIRKDSEGSSQDWILECGQVIRGAHKLVRPNGPAPACGDYFVRYVDGYESWSPASAFEDGYTRIVE